MQTRSSREWKERRDAERARVRSGQHFLGTLGRADARIGGTTTGLQIEKENASQSGPYMAAAKALGYCMRCGKVSSGPGSLHFCHADEGKGQGIKTDVRRGWPGCPGCHEEVGRRLTKPVRRAVEFILGLMTRCAVREAGTWPKKLEDNGA